MGTGVPWGVPRLIPEVTPLVSHPLDVLMREAVVKTMSNENVSPAGWRMLVAPMGCAQPRQSPVSYNKRRFQRDLRAL